MNLWLLKFKFVTPVVIGQFAEKPTHSQSSSRLVT